MNRIFVFALTIQLIAIMTMASENWSTSVRGVKYAQYGRKLDTSNNLSDYVQIGTTDNLNVIYFATCPTCSIDGAKAILAIALTANSTGNNFFFNVLSNSGTTYYIDAAFVKSP